MNAVPFGGKKKGADSGIDGLLYFKPEGKATEKATEKATVSVKGDADVDYEARPKAERAGSGSRFGSNRRESRW